MTGTVEDNRERNRFELEVDGQTVFADYRRTGDTVYLTHVEAPPSLRGTGAAGRLMEGIAEQARSGRLKLVPYCSYAAAWLRRHREHADLLA